MGLEGFTGNESILYHLELALPREGARRVHADRARGVGSRDARAPHFRTRTTSTPEGDEISGRRTLMWNEDVEISLCRPDRHDGLLLPQRRGRRGDLRPRGHGHARDDLRRRAVQGRRLRRHPARHDVPVRARRASSATSSSRRPGLIEIPRRYRNEYGQILEGAPVLPPRHPSADRAAHAPRPRRVPRQGARARRLPGRTSSTTTRSTSSAGTASSTRGRSRSTTSSRSPGGSISRRRRTRRSRARTSSSARSARASSTSTRRRSRSRTTTRICSRRR